MIEITEQISMWGILIITMFLMWHYFKSRIEKTIDDAFAPVENKINNFRESQKITEADKEKINFIEGYECLMRFHKELDRNTLQLSDDQAEWYKELTEDLNRDYKQYTELKNDVGIKQYAVRYKKA